MLRRRVKRQLETLEEQEWRLRLSAALECCNSKHSRDQMQGINSLYEMFSKPDNKCTQSRVIREIGGLSVLVSLLNSKESSWNLRARALYTLWNLSALSDNKIILFEEGIAEVLLSISIPVEEGVGDRVLVGVLAIIQNISEYKFGRGERNPNQVHLYQIGVFQYVSKLMCHEDTFVRFLSCMTVANLAHNRLVRKMITTDGCESVLQQLPHFISDYLSRDQADSELFRGWLSLQPHVPLLSSEDEPIQIWSLFCVGEFCRLAVASSTTNDNYGSSSLGQIWHDLGLNEGVTPIRRLARSGNPVIAQMAQSVIDLLGVKEDVDMMLETKSSVGSDFISALSKGMYSDISFNCHGAVFPAHRIIIASRCPALAAMLSSGLAESTMKEIPVHFSKEVDFIGYYFLHRMSRHDLKDAQVFGTFLQFLYSAATPDIDPSTALELLDCADMFDATDLKLHIEEFLWNFIEISNVCMILVAAQRHRCTRL